MVSISPCPYPPPILSLPIPSTIPIIKKLKFLLLHSLYHLPDVISVTPLTPLGYNFHFSITISVDLFLVWYRNLHDLSVANIFVLAYLYTAQHPPQLPLFLTNCHHQLH